MTSPDDRDPRPWPPPPAEDDEAAGSGTPPPPPPPPPSTAGWRPAPPQGEPWRPSPAPPPGGSEPWADPAQGGTEPAGGGSEPWADPAPGTGAAGPAGGAIGAAAGGSEPWAVPPPGTGAAGPAAGPAAGAAGGGSEPWADPAPGTPGGGWGQPAPAGSGDGVPPNWRAPTSGQWPAPPPAPPNWPPPPDAGRASEPSEIWAPPPGRYGEVDPFPSPLSPAYSTPASPAYTAGGPSGTPPLVETTEPPGHKRRWLLAGLGILAVVALAAGAFVLLRGGGSDDNYVFGTVGSIAGDVMVHVGDEQPRPLEKGENVEAGWVVEAPGSSAVSLDLTDGGVVRFDSGATLTFVDRAQSSGDGGDPDPAIQMDGGRTWVNPAGAGKSADIGLDIPAAKVALTGNPVALDCTSTCTVEAPGGGVKVTTDGDLVAAPGPNENLSVTDGTTLAVTTAAGPSAWAQQNLDADAHAGLPAPEAVDAPGIKGTAVVDGTYALTLTVTGDPSGDAIPSELTFPNGKQFSVNLVVDGSGCVTVPCDVDVTADDGATGTARIEAGTMNLSFNQPIDCYDESFTNVVTPGIGTTAVQALLRITDVTQDGERWVASAVDGEGTVAANLTTRCNEGETLGTSTSTMKLSGAGGV